MFSLRSLLFVRWVALVVALATTSGRVGAQSVQESATVRRVASSDTVEGELSGGRPAQFSIDLAADHFAMVVVSHRIDVVVRAIGAGNGDRVEISSDGAHGELRLPIHVITARVVRFEVAATYPKNPRGAYTLRIENLRAATAADRQIAETR